jgi:hypothetical protein
MVNYNVVKESYRGLFLEFLRKMIEPDLGPRLEEGISRNEAGVLAILMRRLVSTRILSPLLLGSFRLVRLLPDCDYKLKLKVMISTFAKRKARIEFYLLAIFP